MCLVSQFAIQINLVQTVQTNATIPTVGELKDKLI